MNIKKFSTAVLAATLMLFLIFDPETGLSSTKDAVMLCLESVIPSLFPFIILSGIITTSLIGSKISILKPLGGLCGIPNGAEGLLLISLVGGYPVGAQCVSQAYESGQISKIDAQRMLGFCNNAGPAFIFGITASLFRSPFCAWSIWAIQILSAIAVGMLLPYKSGKTCHRKFAAPNQSIATYVEKSVKTMGIICGWIISTKIITGYLENRLTYLLPDELKIGINGLFEISNGCICLHQIQSQQLRFIYANTFLSFGGLCVWMQTISVTGSLSKRLCFAGKLLQTGFAIVLSIVFSYFLFPADRIQINAYIVCFLCITCISALIIKKTVALQKKMLYTV